MKPKFTDVWNSYPRPQDGWSRERLFREMGWDDLISNTNYSNTCAIRTSYALQKAGFPVKSGAGMKALKGVNKGRAIEISQKRLSDHLNSVRDALAAEPVPFAASLSYPLTR